MNKKMKKFILMSDEEKREVFQAVSFSKGMRPDIIETDLAPSNM